MAYIQHNENPAGRNVGDCTVRAIAKGLGQSWEETYVGIALQGYVMRDMPSANHVWGSYLRSHGFAQDKIATLQAENQSLKLAASQSNQNAVLMAAMDANKAEILRRTGAECPTPAYVVQPPQPVTFPNFCNPCNNGCGC